MIETQTISRRLFLTVNTILLVLLAFTCLYPIWYTFCLSFSDKAATNAGWVTLYPIGFTTSAYGEIIKDTAFFNSFKISLERVFIGTPLTLIIVIMIAYPLSRSQREFHGRNVTMWIVVFCMLFNGGTIPWYMCMKNYGMMDNMAGLILSGSLPVYNVILMMNFFRNFPKDVEEAAIMDGAGKWRTLFQIVVPCSKSVIATITLFVSVYYWNE